MIDLPPISCGCVNTKSLWRPWPKDTVLERDVEGTHGYDIEHDCERLRVYKRRIGVHRIYIKKHEQGI